MKCVTLPRGSYSKQYIGEPVASTVLLRSLGTVLEMPEERETVWRGWSRLLLRTVVSLSPQASSRPLQPFLKLVDLHLSGHTCGRGPAASSTENTRTEISCAVAISASLFEPRFVEQRTLTYPFGCVLCPPNRDSEHETVLCSRKCFQNNFFPNAKFG